MGDRADDQPGKTELPEGFQTGLGELRDASSRQKIDRIPNAAVLENAVQASQHGHRHRTDDAAKSPGGVGMHLDGNARAVMRLSDIENADHATSSADRLGMLGLRTKRDRFVLRMWEKIKAPADAADKPDHHSRQS